MQDLFAGGAEENRFATPVPPAIQHLLKQATAAYHDTERAEALLWQARQLNPGQLEVYFALYKFYFYRKRLPEAENAARLGLAEAAAQGGFSGDWRELDANSADWNNHSGPVRFFLFTLKALSFIRLRQFDIEGAEAILAKLAELDPRDQVGHSVIVDLAASAREMLNG